MKKVKLAGMDVAQIVLGCMRISDMNEADALTHIQTALDCGIDFFDHADVYGGGKSEEVFAKAFNKIDINREDVIIQTKCGIRKGMFDYSKENILNAVEGSLKRLDTDYIDILLLHRPDALVEPEEVAEAFSKLHSEGKVRNFGVSNHNPMQIELLNKYLECKLVANQLQLSITNTGMIDAGLNVNMEIDRSVVRDSSILDYCRLKDITVQAWSPFQYGFFEGVFLDNDKFPELNVKLNQYAEKYCVTNTAIATAWIMRHPAGIQVIAGTTKPSRVKDICKASDVDMTRQEWYEIYLSAGNTLP